MDMYFINEILVLRRRTEKLLNPDARLDTVIVSSIVSDVMGHEFGIHAGMLKYYGLDLIRNVDDPGCSISIFDSSKTRMVGCQ